MKKSEIRSLLIRLWRDEQGQDLVEYALIVAAVGLALITPLIPFRRVFPVSTPASPPICPASAQHSSSGILFAGQRHCGCEPG